MRISRDGHAHGMDADKEGMFYSYFKKSRKKSHILSVGLVHRSIGKLLLLLRHCLTRSTLLGLGLVDTVGSANGCSMWSRGVVRSVVSELLLMGDERAGGIRRL